ncbi:hypothetical protein Pmar_PMAR026352, partial [Perkinsus marinus ATCC 50983]
YCILGDSACVLHNMAEKLKQPVREVPAAEDPHQQLRHVDDEPLIDGGLIADAVRNVYAERHAKSSMR